METWDTLYRRHNEATRWWLMRHVRRVYPNLNAVNAQDRADEALHEAWAQLIARQRKEQDVMPGLLMKMAKRALHEYARKEAVELRNVEGFRAEANEAQNFGRGAEISEHIREVAEALPPRQLEAWSLVKWYRMALKDAAYEMGLTRQESVSALLVKAKANLVEARCSL